MGNWAQLYADLTAQLQAGQHLGFWDNAFVGFYQSFLAAGRWRLYLSGLLTTLEATVLALLLGVALGVIVAVVRTAHDQQRAGHKNVILGVFNAICKIYTTVIRGTPPQTGQVSSGILTPFRRKPRSRVAARSGYPLTAPWTKSPAGARTAGARRCPSVYRTRRSYRRP